jgi:hypothetical protein
MTRAESAEAKYGVSTGVRSWSKDQSICLVLGSGLFAFTNALLKHLSPLVNLTGDYVWQGRHKTFFDHFNSAEYKRPQS